MLLIAVDLPSNDVLHGGDGCRHFIMICQNDIQDATVMVVVLPNFLAMEVAETFLNTLAYIQHVQNNSILHFEHCLLPPGKYKIF